MKKKIKLIMIQVIMTLAVSGLFACNVMIEMPSELDEVSEDEYTSSEDWNEASNDDINSETGIEEDGQNDLLTEEPLLSFRNDDLLNDHFEKHGIDMGFETPKEYELAAAKVVANPDALHKTEKEDGDDVYYLESTNEFVIVSTDGYLRTYFLPDKGIAYYEKQ